MRDSLKVHPTIDDSPVALPRAEVRVINDKYIVELKAVSNLAKIHERQVEGYLKSTGMESGLLVNFGNLRRLEWRVISP